MNQNDAYDFQQVYRLVRVFGKQQGHYGHVPGMFGIVFKPLSVGQVCAALDEFFLVYEAAEIDYPPESFVVCHCLKFHVPGKVIHIFKTSIANMMYFWCRKTFYHEKIKTCCVFVSLLHGLQLH